MRVQIIGISLLGLLLMLVPASPGVSAGYRIGLVSDGPLKPDAEVAYGWAESHYDAEIIPRPTAKEDLTDYGVVWWHESNGPAIPDAFLEPATVKAFRSYVEAGGGLLLSNLAFHYLFDMGVEPGEPRYFGANPNSPLDWTDIQITPGQENHPIFRGLNAKDGRIEYDIQGWAEGSDFYTPNGPAGPTTGELLAQVVEGHPQTNPLVEYHVGEGTILAIGWVWSSWSVNRDLEDVHGKLHANMLDYLASRSRFAAVDARGKLALTWGQIKKTR